jgi:glycine/D-amino acid oxidase-like deaminating enzyme/nitrite reductase/ring-hydroxylating ferredoxin subunit
MDASDLRSPDSPWEDTSLPGFPAIAHDTTVDVAVIGAGLTGITTAVLLMQQGLRVALIERDRVGGVDTRRTTAHLTQVTDTRLSELVSTVGEDRARASWDAGRAAIEQIAALVSQYGIGCEFTRVPGWLHVPAGATAAEARTAAEDLQADVHQAVRFGFDVRMVDRTPLIEAAAMRIEDQGVFHPHRYLDGLLRRLMAGGCTIFEHTEAHLGQARGVVHCGSYTVRAGAVVVATHNPLHGREGSLSAELRQTTLALYTSYAMAGRTTQVLTPGCYWDTSNPYRYVRVHHQDAGSVVIAGGEDHKTGQMDDTRVPFATLGQWFGELCPEVEITHQWSGQVIETLDGLPLVGEVADGQFVATGYAGNGMTFGTVAAMIVRDAIVGQESPWAACMDIHRRMITRSPLEYVRENVDFPRHVVLDRLTRGSSQQLEDLAPGDGAVVQLDGQAVAAAREPDGTLRLSSAVCSHMGCLVRWNPAERTWDCPCHGSRFSAGGGVLAGPAEHPLAPIDT